MCVCQPTQSPRLHRQVDPVRYPFRYPFQQTSHFLVLPFFIMLAPPPVRRLVLMFHLYPIYFILMVMTERCAYCVYHIFLPLVIHHIHNIHTALHSPHSSPHFKYIIITHPSSQISPPSALQPFHTNKKFNLPPWKVHQTFHLQKQHMLVISFLTPTILHLKLSEYRLQLLHFNKNCSFSFHMSQK